MQPNSKANLLLGDSGNNRMELVKIWASAGVVNMADGTYGHEGN